MRQDDPIENVVRVIWRDGERHGSFTVAGSTVALVLERAYVAHGFRVKVEPASGFTLLSAER